jgi:hypothetical protein
VHKEIRQVVLREPLLPREKPTPKSARKGGGRYVQERSTLAKHPAYAKEEFETQESDLQTGGIPDAVQGVGIHICGNQIRSGDFGILSVKTRRVSRKPV